MRRIDTTTAQRGFTLVEAIIVIVVTGVLATVVAVFIRSPMQGYVDSVGRAEVSDAADLALRRMARDLRLALPNSIRTTSNNSAIEFLETKAGGRYVAVEDGSGDFLDFNNAADTTFAVFAPMKSLSEPGRVVGGDYVVVHNLGEPPMDAYRFASAPRNIARIASYAGGVFTLENNPFANQSPPIDSPDNRFQVVSGPVSYYCTDENGTFVLWRHWGYDIAQLQAVPPSGGQRAVLASRLHTCADIFRVGNTVNARTTSVVIDLQIRARNEDDPAIRLVHQIFVNNTP